MSDVRQAFERLAQMTLAPYILAATRLIGRPRKSGSNMFRHQIDTLAVLMDYKLMEPVLLKASCVHDLVEDCPELDVEEIRSIDQDGPAVLNLVLEVTRRADERGKEPKGVFLSRIMTEGSRQARLLKMADRISNLVSLGYVHDPKFVMRTILETRQFILPHAQAVHEDMFREMSDLIRLREDALMGNQWHRLLWMRILRRLRLAPHASRS